MKTEALGSTPSNNYLVGRIKRNILSTSWVGAIVTDRESARAGRLQPRLWPGRAPAVRPELEIDSYVLRSDTPGRPGRNQARKLADRLARRRAERLGGVQRGRAELQPGGRVRAPAEHVAVQRRRVLAARSCGGSEAIRNLTFGTSVDYYNDGDGRDRDARRRRRTLGIQFENNGSVNFTANRDLRSAGARRSRSGRPWSIPVGDYQYRRYTASVEHREQPARWAVSGNTSWGEFWNGDSESVGGSLDMRPNYHLNLDLNYSRNHVTLPTASSPRSWSARGCCTDSTPRAFFNAFIQYNADTHQVSSNLRFNFTHHPLSDIYIVYNDRRDTHRRRAPRARLHRQSHQPVQLLTCGGRWSAPAVWAAGVGTAFAQAVGIDHDAIRATRIVTAVRITEQITLDGRLDEAVWMQAPPADDFIQKLPEEWRAGDREAPMARFAYDEDNLYIGVVCFESEPDKILIKDLRRTLIS